MSSLRMKRILGLVGLPSAAIKGWSSRSAAAVGSMTSLNRVANRQLGAGCWRDASLLLACRWRVASVLFHTNSIQVPYKFHTNSIQTRLLLPVRPDPPAEEPPHWLLRSGTPSLPTPPGGE